MRLLILGSRGLLGAAIHREFASEEVIAADHGALDITHERAVVATVSEVRPDLILNCAAYNNVDGAEEDPVTALTVNAFAVRAIARAAAEAGATFVHYSSDFVFDGETDRPYTEEDAPNPLSVYAASKLLGDWFALASPRAYVLRVESLFGKPGPASTRRGSLAAIVDGILEGAEVPVFVDRTVSPTHTADIGRATAHLVRSHAPPGLYHCVSTGLATWPEIAEYTAHVLGKPLRHRPMTLADARLRARRPRYCALSNAKLAAAGHIMPRWQDAIEEYLRGSGLGAGG
ncbi:MAG: dTDP-4-dehydrorhamnose reductase [Acidobacteria bacterium]|nr:dTDP-4-dehydrorhamnose reductase [Acidobacteriota bacterium]